ncbi:MAG: MFS transporter, partial [Syntrophales bacterium]|nr:MFS transporter [Syntrophales bacterium]
MAPSLRRRIIEFFGLKKSMVALLAMVILVGLGEKMAERFLPIYLLALGGGTLTIGLLNAMDNLLSALYSFPGGYLSDRLGYKRALLIFNLIALFGYAIVILFPYWQAVIIGSIFFLSWTAISLPATMSLVSRVLPQDKRTMGVSLHSLVRRIPMALGPLIGGVLIGIYGDMSGVRLAFVAAFVLGIASLILQQVMIEDDNERGKAEKLPSRLWRYVSPALRNLLVSDILIRFAEQIPYAFVVVWCIKYHGISAFQFGILTTIEMVTAFL